MTDNTGSEFGILHDGPLGEYISPFTTAARVLNCIIAYGPIDFMDLKQKVIQATPEITEHPELEISDSLLELTTARLMKTTGVVLDENERLRHIPLEWPY